MLKCHGKVKIHAIYTSHRYYHINTDGDHRSAYKSSHHIVFMFVLSQCCIIKMTPLGGGWKWTW